MKNILIIFFVGTLINVSAQEGSIEVIKDPRIDALVDKQGQPILPETETQIDGYRIQLFFDQDKKVLDESRSFFISKYPRVATYVEYSAPYYYLKVGDFRSHLEAVRLKSTLDEKFPTSFIVKEKVFLPPLEKQELKN
ncbi:MAG: hypothetical protein ACO2Z9_09760 [Crocinitomicaceae bacterium]